MEDGEGWVMRFDGGGVLRSCTVVHCLLVGVVWLDGVSWASSNESRRCNRSETDV